MLITQMGQKASSPSPIFGQEALTRDSTSPQCDIMKMPFYSTKKAQEGTKIRVASFNILAQCYIFPDTGEFSQMSKYLTDPLPRASSLHQVISHIDPDIILLQEVDSPVSKLLFERMTKKYRLASFTRPRGKSDGNTIAFDKKRFYEVAKGCIDFNQFALQTQFKDDPGFQTNNICVWVRLRDNLTERDILVYNAHFFWNPKRDDVKYFQMFTLLNIIMKKVKPDDLIILGGDLNSCPNSNLISLLNCCEPKLERIEVRDGNELAVLQNCKTMFEWLDKGILGELCFTSAYSLYSDVSPKDSTDYSIFQHKVFGHKKGYPPFTNYSRDFKSSIDHIIACGQFKVGALLGLPTLGDFEGTNALPNIHFPSDHLPIAADLYYSATH